MMTSNVSLKTICATNANTKAAALKNNWNLNCIRVRVLIEKDGIKNTSINTNTIITQVARVAANPKR
jgi:hypothetical protein